MRALAIIIPCLFLTACFPLAAPFVVVQAFDEENAAKFYKEKQEKLREDMNPCKYDAVENNTGHILCKANDCACHDELVRRTFEEAKYRDGFPR